MTLKELIDVIDENRESKDEMITIVDDDRGNMIAPTSHPIWRTIEHREVGALYAAGTSEYEIWLKREAADDQNRGN